MSARDELQKMVLMWMRLPSGGSGDADDADGLVGMILTAGYRKVEL